MQIQKAKISDLISPEWNPRQITEEELKKLQVSLDEFGYIEPIIVNDVNNHIVGGNQRCKALKTLGYDEVDVVYVHIEDIAKEKACNVALNKISGDWDHDKLQVVLEEIELSPIDIKLTGFEELELEKLDITPTPDKPDEEPSEIIEDNYQDENIEVTVEEAELYQLGNHYLLCGDSTVEANVSKLMNGAEIDLLFTDPPYGVDVVKGNTIGGDGPLGSIGGTEIVKAKKYKPVLNDDEPFDPTFLLNYDCDKIIWGANNFSSKLPDNAKWLVWLKEPLNEEGMFEKLEHTFGNVELAWTNLKGIGCMCYHHLWRGLLRGGDRKTELSERVHPTQKPVKLLADILKDYSEEGINVLDLFGGSGSTLIACEQLNRNCYMMELDPYYCQVIINRWEEYTGQKAEKIN